MMKKDTLCWTCRKSGGKCLWSRAFLPVPGWKAKPTRIKCTAKGNDGRMTASFRVDECPEFEKG